MFPGQKTENEHSGYNNGQKGYDPLATKATEGSGFLRRLRNVKEKGLDFQRLQK